MSCRLVYMSAAALLLASASTVMGQDVRLFEGPRPAPEAIAPDRIVPDAFIVNFDPVIARVIDALRAANINSTGVDTLDALHQQFAVRDMRKQFQLDTAARQPRANVPDLNGYYVITFDPTTATLDQAMAAYRTNPHVRSVEPIGIHPVYVLPNDGNFPSQWHLNQTSDKDIDAPEAWNIHTGSPTITVAVLDTGVRYYHRDLGGANASASNPGGTSGNIWINTAEKNGAPGIDDDGNGYVDDWAGWDFVTGVSGCVSGEDCATADNDPRDFNGHGTHCAGLVSAINNNGYAVASPAGGWGNGTLQATSNGVRTMCLRIGWSGTSFGQEVGYVRMDFAASALYYAANKGVKIASCSWGSSNSGGIDAAINYFLASGGIIFKAAGNANSSSADYMCSRNDIYCVAATNQNDQKASFSSYGSWVDIAAPGVSILSTYHVHSDPNPDYVASMDGTSMATPMVASAAALVWSANPTWSSSQVWTRLRDTADNINALNPSYVGLLGSGRINIHAALSGGTTAPFCGNGVCDSGENPCNCPQDCGPPPAEICNDGIDNDCDNLIDCADSNCSSAPNCAPPPSSQAIVDCITYATSGGGNKNLSVTIKVVDANNNPVAGATVAVTVSGQANGSSFSGSGTTSTNGTVTITKGNAKNTCFSTNVTSITKSGFTFDGAEPPNGFRKGVDASPDADCRSSNDPCG